MELAPLLDTSIYEFMQCDGAVQWDYNIWIQFRIALRLGRYNGIQNRKQTMKAKELLYMKQK